VGRPRAGVGRGVQRHVQTRQAMRQGRRHIPQWMPVRTREGYIN
jgi:hypothetical protein